MSAEIDELSRRERAAESVLREARDARKRAEDLDRDKRLESLKPLICKAHDTFCAWNHTDGCGWLYEVDSKNGHNWLGDAHARWLRRYEEIMEAPQRRAAITVDILYKILDQVSELRGIHPDALWLISGRMNP
jgi:hypothetical protein